MTQNLARVGQHTPRNPTGERSLTRLVSALDSAAWNLTSEIRGQFSKESIDAAIDEAEYQLSPAGVEDIVIAVDRLLTFARTFAIQTDRAGLTGIWSDGCKGMPRRALREGVTEVLAKSTDTYRVPMPGAVWDIMRDKIAHWESELTALRTVKRQLCATDAPRLVSPERVPVTPEYIRETEEITKRTVAMLKTHSHKSGRIF